MIHPSPDPHSLSRFTEAQADAYETAIAELRAGEKRSHWMWYVFPQVAGLGSSAMAKRYAIQSRDEAVAYLAHPILGRRLLECAEALLGVSGRSAEQIMGYPDCLKLQSSMTLFAEISPSDSVFERVLREYYTGVTEQRTVEFLGSR